MVPKECAVKLVLKETDVMALWVEMDIIIVLMIQLKVKDKFRNSLRPSILCIMYIQNIFELYFEDPCELKNTFLFGHAGERGLKFESPSAAKAKCAEGKGLS